MSRSFKLQVMVSDTLISRIDALCKVTNCSRSSICSLALTKYISELEKLFNTSDSFQDYEDFQNIKLE